LALTVGGITAGPPNGTFNYYISTTGADTNPGTLASPWALTSLLNPRCGGYNSAIKANQALMAGKSIGIVAGTYNLMQNYNVGSLSNMNFVEPLLITPSGTSTNFTYLGSCSSSGQYQQLAAKINFGLTDANNPAGSGEPAPGIGGSDALGTGYTIIDGLELTNTNDQIVSLGSGNNVTNLPNHIRNCYVHGVNSTTTGANSAGIRAYSCNGSIISNNYVTNIVNNTNRNTAIETWGCVNTVIQYNTIIMSNAGAAGIYVKNQTPQGQHSVAIQYNYVDLSAARSLGGSGIVSWDLVGSSSNTSYLRNNILLGVQPMQQGIAGVTGQAYAENKVISNNTLVSIANGSATQMNPGGIHVVGSGACVRHYNNIYIAPSVGAGYGYFCCNADNPALIDYNLYPTALELGLSAAGGAVNTWPRSFVTSLSAWATLINSGAPNCIGKDAHARLGNATLVGGTQALPAQAYQLSSGSAGKGAGSSNGQTSGTATDMGAWGGIDVNTGQSVAQIGCSFTPGSSTVVPPTVPMSPVLTVS
jgi:hypothetical protein